MIEVLSIRAGKVGNDVEITGICDAGAAGGGGISEAVPAALEADARWSGWSDSKGCDSPVKSNEGTDEYSSGSDTGPCMSPGMVAMTPRCCSALMCCNQDIATSCSNLPNLFLPEREGQIKEGSALCRCPSRAGNENPPGHCPDAPVSPNNKLAEKVSYSLTYGPELTAASPPPTLTAQAPLIQVRGALT